jgi:3-oxoacyl-[acyl-carrier protein] reductase
LKEGIKMGKLTGQTVLVTGAARGLGRAYALHLAKLGANVGVILHSFKASDTIVDEIKACGVKAARAEADVSIRNRYLLQ